MAPTLAALLANAAAAGEPLLGAESLEDFQRTARDVCNGFSITPEQLASVRPALTGLDANGWAALADSGAALADATRCVGPPPPPARSAP